MTNTTRAQKWNAETSAHPFAKNDRWAIVFDPTPGGIDNGDGTRTFSLRFPALFLSEYVDDPEQAAKDIAQALNEYEPGLLARAEAAERERDAAVTALMSLERRATLVSDKGATTGMQWTQLTIGLLAARGVLSKMPTPVMKNDAALTGEGETNG